MKQFGWQVVGCSMHAMQRQERHGHQQCSCVTVHCVSKSPPFTILKALGHRPILIRYGMQHTEETAYRCFKFCPPCLKTVTTLPCEMHESYSTS